MKLQVQYNRITIISTLIILLVAAAGYYFLLRYVLVSQLDGALKVEEAEIHDHISKNNKLPDPTVYKDQRITFEQTDQQLPRRFNDLSIYSPEDKENEFSRQLVFPVTVNGKQYMASVTKSQEATEDLIWIILLSTIALFVLLTVILFFTNRVLLKKLWRPFRDTLSSIKQFNLSAPVPVNMQPTRITEFRELNESIRMMTNKVMKDYQSLKNFTDHASHELQTPLAIINSKLDVLIQEPELSERSMQQVQSIYTAVEKLSRLSQSLLLLTRIENNQYTISENVSINLLFEEKIGEMQELIRTADLTVKLEAIPLEVIMNKDLAEILVANLITNAIRHSEAGDVITINTGKKSLSVCNTGKTSLDEKKVFDRFYKSDRSHGTGLGLAIVRQICDQYNFRPSYQFHDLQHYFIIDFYAAQN